jgi:hypothetical protein
MSKITLKQVLTILSTVVVITLNVLANALPLNGQNTGEISDRFDIFFVPAGYVFSIWGLIYLGLLFYTIYQALPGQRENPVLNKIAPYYWISSLANTAWIFLWHYEVFSITLIAMLAILITLILIYINLNETKGSLKWLVRLPFSIYLGWISVATIANVSQLLFTLSWSGFGIHPATWAIIMIGVASLLGLIMSWRESDPFYNFVLVWAFIGISVSQADTQAIVTTTWVSVVVILVGILVSSISNRKFY